MIAELVTQWEENKHRLEEYFRTTEQSEYYSYEAIVRKIFEICIPKAIGHDRWDLRNMTVIDDGHYQGTQIFIIPNGSYQPSVEDYVMTDTFYGSCSGCDTLEGIHYYDEGLPTDSQVKEYMTLALHLVQRIKRLGTE